MSGTMRLSILIEAVDRATRPIAALQARLGRVAAGMLVIGRAAQRLGTVSGVGILAGSIGHVAQRARDATGAVSGLAGRLALLGAGGAFAFNRLFVQGAAEAEDFRLRFQQLLGSTEAGQRRFAELQGFASRFGLPVAEIAQAGIALEILGRRGAAADRTLGAAADAAGTFGGSISQAMDALASATRGEMDPIERYGIQARTEGNAIVMQWRENGRLIRAAVDKNNPARIADMVTRAWEGRARGGREKLAQGWNGMLRRLGSEWSNFTLAIAEAGPFDFLKEQLRDILKWVERMKADGSLARWASETGAAITSAFQTMRAFLIGTAETPGLIERLGNIFGRLGRFLAPVVRAFGGLETTLAVIGLIVAGPAISAIVALGSAVLGLAAALLLTPAGWFAIAIGAIAKLAYLIYDNWADIAGFFSRLWNGVTSAIRRFVTSEQVAWLGDAFGALARGIMSGWAPIQDFFVDLWSGIRNAFAAGWAFVEPIVNALVRGANALASILPGQGSGRAAGGSGPLAPQGQGLRRPGVASGFYGPDALGLPPVPSGGSPLPAPGGGGPVRVRAGLDVNIRLPPGVGATATERGAGDGMRLNILSRGLMATPR